jgi:hypothetical protein
MKDLKNKRKAMGERAQRIVRVAWSCSNLPSSLSPSFPTPLTLLPDSPSPSLNPKLHSRDLKLRALRPAPRH